MALLNGGPAFPSFHSERVYNDNADRIGHPEYVPVGGMSLRDYFAGQALVGISQSLHVDIEEEPYDAPIPLAVAELAYSVADAMLKARGAE